MSDAFIMRRGGAGLNFKVVGGMTKPENPKENMIWVETETTITGWAFSASEPYDRAEGVVWFKVHTSSSVGFSAISGKEIYVYPIGAYQYVSGVWQFKPAKVYQDSIWIDMLTYFYRNGDQCSEKTGGWTISGYSAEVEIQAGSLQSSAMYFAGIHGAYRVLGTKNQIHIPENATKIVFSMKVTGVDQANKRAFIVDFRKTKNFSNSAVAEARAVIVGEYDVQIPLNGISGDYYLTIRTFGSTDIKGYVKEVYMV